MTTPTFPAIWYTSGTPIGIGQRGCAFERWLSNHAGTHGTGWRRKAVAVPLATGKGVHQGIELVGKWILEWQGAHPNQRLIDVARQFPDVVAWAASEAAGRYAAGAVAKGLEITKTDLDAKPAIDRLILEQQTLIEAQVWIYCLARLPVMLADYRLLDVEREETPVIDCSCGLGDWVGQVETHAARGCTGICMQGRADFLWEGVSAHVGGKIVYEEFKTKATPNYGWENAWEHAMQLVINMEAGSQRLGREISEAFVPVLYKGRRDRFDRNDQSAPRVQQSPLVYGYFDPGNGMTRLPEWSARNYWKDDYGKGHYLPKTYARVGIWDDTVDTLTGSNPNGVAFRGEASRVERWVTGWILPSQYPELLKVLGPFPKPRARVPKAIQSVLTEERRWRDTVADLRAAGVYTASDIGVYRFAQQLAETAGETDYVERQMMAADVIARSWNCTKFDGTPCAYKQVCHDDLDITTSPEFEIRTPHHSIEAAALRPYVEALGLAFTNEDEDEDGGEA